MTRLVPSFRLRTVALTALFSFTAFFVQAAPSEVLPRPEALTPQPAQALACADGPSFEGKLTSSSSTTALLERSTTGNVYGYISKVVDDWSCTAWYRYDGLAWARNDGELDGNFDWGNLINSTAVSCNWTVNETNYLKANSTNDCADSDAEYAMPIYLANTSAGDLLEWEFHQDSTPDEPGDFAFIHSDCETYYGGEEIAWNQPFTTSQVGTRPGNNCDPYDIDGTNTTQALMVDASAPTAGSVTINGGAYVGSTTVTLSVSATDTPALVESMRFSNDGTNWGSWVSYPSATGWTLAAGADGSRTVYAQFRDFNGNATTGTGVSDTIILDTTAASPNPPDVTCTTVASAVYQAAANGTCYFRPAAASTVTLTASASDAQSGITYLRFQDLSPTTGWTPSPALPSNDTGSPYTEALAFSGSAVSATIGILARNGAGTDSSVRTITLTSDATAPTATFTTPGAGTTLQPSDALSVTWSETEAGSGVATRSLKRQAATWDGTTCGTFADDATFSPTSAISPVSDAGLLVNTCYRWVQTLTDRVGNSLASTSGSIVRDTLANLGMQGQHAFESWDLGAGDSLAVNMANGNLVLSHPLVSLPIRGSSLDLGLTYNRHDPADIGMGPGWRLNAFRRLTVLGNGDITFIAGDGARYTFTGATGSPVVTYTRPPALYATLTRDTAASPDRFTLTYRDQSVDKFDELVTGTGYLVREEDRHGNGVDLGYVSGELRTITDTVPATDRIVDLTWASGKLTKIEDWAYLDGSGNVATSASGTRRATRFHYDGSNRLAGWTDPLGPSTGDCGTDASHRTCVDYTSATLLEISKTQTYTTEASGTLGSSTRAVTTAVTFTGSDVSLVKDAAEVAASSTGTVISKPSTTERQAVRKGSGTSQDTTTKYTRPTANDAYARISSVKRWDGAAWLETGTSWDASHPIEPASVSEDVGGSLARTTIYTYVSSSMGLVSKIVEPLNASDDRWTEYTYNTNNDVTAQTVSFEGASAVTTRSCYTNSGCSTSATDPLLHATIENYVDGSHGGTDGHLEDLTTSYAYDADGQRISQTRHVYEDGNATALDERVDTWTYDEFGNVTAAIVNDDDGAVTGGTDVSASATTQARTDLTTTYSHDTAGNVVTVADPRRAIVDVAETLGADDYRSNSVYNAVGELILSVLPTTFGISDCSPSPGCRQTTTAYDEFGAARATVDPDDTVIATVSDEAGRMIKMWEDVDGAGGANARQTSALTLDAQGRTLLAEDDRQLDGSSLGQTTVTYDRLGRVTSSVTAAGETSGDESTTTTSYDALDRVTQVIVGTESAAAQTTKTTYDMGGRVSSVDDEFTCSTVTYDHLDRPTAIIEGKVAGTPCTGSGTRTVVLAYDALGRLTSRTTGGDTLEANDYDSLGRVTQTWSDDGTYERVTEAWSNLLDEPLETYRYSDDGTTVADETWSRSTRDGGGNETDRCTWTATPTEWCHNAGDTSWASPSPISRSSSSYDALGLRIGLFVPGEGETTYDPTADYQVDKTYLTTKTNISDQVTAEHQTDFGYDSRDRLISIDQQACLVTAATHTCTSTPVVTGSTDYTYDDNGNRISVVEDNGSGAVTRYYCYDARDQLTSVSSSSATCASGVIETYSYDEAGNRTTDGTRDFTYDAQGQLATCDTSPACEPAFDDEGRLTAITNQAADSWTYVYDDEGRLVSACKAASCSGTPARLDFTYDASGHRIRIVETPSGASPTTITTDFAYDGDTVIRETATSSAGPIITRTFTTDEAGAIHKMTVVTTGGGSTTDDGIYLVTYNGHGDAIGLAEIDATDGHLIPAARITYSTWGTPTVSAQSGYGALGFRYLYVGRFDVQWDDFASAGLHYMHARHYSPEFGRFMQPDPAAAEANLYGYAGNSPVTKLDPNGQIAWCLIPLIGWAACAVGIRLTVWGVSGVVGPVVSAIGSMLIRSGPALVPIANKVPLAMAVARDAAGRVVSVSATITQTSLRTGTAATQAARNWCCNGQAINEAGHLIAKVFGGPGGLKAGNIIPMLRALNWKDYKALETQLLKAAEQGLAVKVRIEPIYGPNSGIVPHTIRYFYQIGNDIPRMRQFPNT